VPLIEVKPGTPMVPAGTYSASLIGIRPRRMVSQFSNPPGQEEDRLEWTWLVDGPDKEVEITSLTTLATGPKSRIFEYLLALVGPDKAQVGAGFEESDLVGKGVMVSVIVNADGFSKIDTIVAAPVVGAKAKASANGASSPAAPVERVKAPEPDPAPEDDLPF
jgi:hypothetical protein